MPPSRPADDDPAEAARCVAPVAPRGVPSWPEDLALALLPSQNSLEFKFNLHFIKNVDTVLFRVEAVRIEV